MILYVLWYNQSLLALPAWHVEQSSCNCHASVHLSVCPSRPAQAGLLLWAQSPVDIDRLEISIDWCMAGAEFRNVSQRRSLNVDLFCVKSKQLRSFCVYVFSVKMNTNWFSSIVTTWTAANTTASVFTLIFHVFCAFTITKPINKLHWLF